MCEPKKTKIYVGGTRYKRGDWFTQVIERAYIAQQKRIEAINHFTKLEGEDKDV